MTTPGNGAHILVVGVGGLGTHLVREALDRGAEVSVLVRDRAKLETRLDAATIGRLSRVTVGDATDPAALDAAMAGVDAALSGNGAHTRMARLMAEAVERNGVGKIIWPAGGTNLMSDDGVTPAYKAYATPGFDAEAVYLAHQACIDAIRRVGVNYVIFCPGRMQSVGATNPDVASTIRVNRPAGNFVSYEDAAWVILEAALTDAWDRELIAAATP